MRVTPLIFVLSSLFLMTSFPCEACDRLKPSAEIHQGGWYCDQPGSDTVVIFIHGLDSNSARAWLNSETALDKSPPYWPDFVASDPRLGNPSVYLASYPTDFGSGEYAIRDAAEDVFLDLSTKQANGNAVLDKKNILVVAHSLGGIIFRALLVAHHDALLNKRVGLLLVASPSLGSKDADTLSFISGVIDNHLAQELKWRSPDLMTLHQKFSEVLKDKDMPGFVGAELYEQWAITPSMLKRSSITEALYRRSFAPVVDKQSAAVYFNPFQYMVEGSDHFTIAAPETPNDRQQLRLIELYDRMLHVDGRCQAPKDYTLYAKFELTISKDFIRPIYMLEELDDAKNFVSYNTLESEAHPGEYSINLSQRAFPCPGEIFRANLVKVPARGEQQRSIGTTPLCFERLSNSRSLDTHLNCVENERCTIEANRGGLASPCPTLVSTQRDQASEQPIHWATPSLSSITDLDPEDRPGYTEFHIRSGPLTTLPDANKLSYAVTVNGTSIYMDNLPPHRKRTSFRPDGGVDLVFAIENLGFTGGEDGFERIGVEVNFYNGDRLLKTAKLERSYVSYRNAHTKHYDNVDGLGGFEWTGYYRPSKQHESVEVMLTFGDGVKADKAALDARNAIYQGQPVIGVLRPGRIDNGTPGLIFGLKQQSGQIKSLFTQQDAAEICRWIKSATGFESLRNSSYLFQFPAEIFDDQADRGKNLGACWKYS